MNKTIVNLTTNGKLSLQNSVEFVFVTNKKNDFSLNLLSENVSLKLKDFSINQSCRYKFDFDLPSTFLNRENISLELICKNEDCDFVIESIVINPKISFKSPIKTLRLPVKRVIESNNWNVGDISLLRNDPLLPDNRSIYRGTNNTFTWAVFSFDDFYGILEGDQKFRILAKCSTNINNCMKVFLVEKNREILLKELSLTTNFNLFEIVWKADLLQNKSSPVYLKIALSDSVLNNYYTFESIDFVASVKENTNVGDSNGNQLNPKWIEGWPARPELGSFHGIGQPFNISTDSQGNIVWYPLRDYNNWLNRSANIIKVWPNSNNINTWDQIAGGIGDNLDIWEGQLNEINPKRAFDPSYWPTNLPVVFALTGVPKSHSNAKISGSFGNPGIWDEIARGVYDNFYRRLFKRIAQKCNVTGRNPKTVVIRWCWEANGSWYTHSIGPNKQGFINAWRRCIDIMRESVGSVLGQGKSFLVEFGPSGHLTFGMNNERLFNIYPGDDWVDICGLGIHDQIGIKTVDDWNKYLKYPAIINGVPFEGIRDWFDFAVSRKKWIGVSEIESNYVPRNYFPKTENMEAMWKFGFEEVRKAYAENFLYFIYLWNSASSLKRIDGWGEPYRLLYGI